jgi:hypothetical protein
VRTISTWRKAQHSRRSIIAKLVWYATVLPVNLRFLAFTWVDGLDYVYHMGSISLQETLMCFAILINVVHYFDIRSIEQEATKQA